MFSFPCHLSLPPFSLIRHVLDYNLNSDPPAPRPRSRLMEQDEEPNSFSRSKPLSPKKAPAPQPRPRTLLSSPSLSDEGQVDVINPENAEQIDFSKQKTPALMSQKLPNLVMKTHKACIEEMAFKFVQRQNSVDGISSGPVGKENLDQELSPKDDKYCVNNAESFVSDITNESGGRCTTPPVESQAAASAGATLVVESIPGVHVHVYQTVNS